VLNPAGIDDYFRGDYVVIAEDGRRRSLDTLPARALFRFSEDGDVFEVKGSSPVAASPVGPSLTDSSS
jgi:hypothetical protein